MKKIGSILCLTALIVTMTASVCFGAESLEIVDKYPNDGQKNTTIENMCVKLTMSNDMGNKASRKANADCFSLTDDKGKKVPIRVFYDPDDSKKMMVLADTVKIAENKLRIKDNTEYTLHVSGNLTDNDGNTLGSDETISFHYAEPGKKYPGLHGDDVHHVRRYVLLLKPSDEETDRKAES